MRSSALKTLVAAALRAVFALTLLLAAGAQAVVGGGHFEPAWAIQSADGRSVSVHPEPASAHDHAAEAHVQCAVCRVLSMAGRDGPKAPDAPAPSAAMLRIGTSAAIAAADLPAPLLAFRSRAPPA